MSECIDEVVADAGDVALGQFLREFTHGYTAQLASVAREHLIGLIQYSGVLGGNRVEGVHRYRLAAAAGLCAC